MPLEFNLYIGTPEDVYLTIGHVKEFISLCERFGLSDDTQLNDCLLGLSVDLGAGSVEDILCGDCAPRDNNYDLLLKTHSCPNAH